MPDDIEGGAPPESAPNQQQCLPRLHARPQPLFLGHAAGHRRGRAGQQLFFRHFLREPQPILGSGHKVDCPRWRGRTCVDGELWAFFDAGAIHAGAHQAALAHRARLLRAGHVASRGPQGQQAAPVLVVQIGRRDVWCRGFRLECPPCARSFFLRVRRLSVGDHLRHRNSSVLCRVVCSRDAIRRRWCGTRPDPRRVHPRPPLLERNTELQAAFGLRCVVCDAHVVHDDQSMGGRGHSVRRGFSTVAGARPR
mmetsp:Transcript_156061/g.500504  ORF Transcript_156061/g.500504 Transcript_156061/m.500504 type:complete len:252 (-) Transcript_156061:1090-1845(-)